jgi:hypothetical protein
VTRALDPADRDPSELVDRTRVFGVRSPAKAPRGHLPESAHLAFCVEQGLPVR